MQTVNIAAYKFIAIPEPTLWQDPLKSKCDALGLKGTIILADEGINLFLAGERNAIDEILRYLRQDELFGERFHDLEIKESLSSNQPFRRMVVRLAKEIITMKHPTIRPEGSRAPAVDADTLKSWIDQGHDDAGRQVVLVDTRNNYEVLVGSFDQAITFDIERFSQFPDVIRAIVDDAGPIGKDKTIVTFCTGGIRCEKAALFMQELGLERVFQLDGGILRYFERVGGAHWQGECFVFDDRIAVDPSLRVSETYKDRSFEERLRGFGDSREETGAGPGTNQDAAD